MTDAIEAFQKELQASQLVAFNFAHTSQALDHEIQQKCLLLWRQTTLTLKSVHQAQDTIKLMTTTDNRSQMKIVFKMWSQELADDRKYVQLQREFRRIREHAEASEVELEMLRELVSTHNEHQEAMRREIFELRDKLEYSQHSDELVDHLSRDLQKEREKVAQLQDRLQSHLDSKRQLPSSSDCEELSDLDSPTQIKSTMRNTSEEDLRKKAVFLCTPARNAFSAWHWEAFAHKMRKLNRRESSAKSLERRQETRRASARTRSPPHNVNRTRLIKKSNAHVVQKIMEKAVEANVITFRLKLFTAWSNVCTAAHMEDTVEKMVSGVQNWQHSYRIAKRATRTTVEMFTETAFETACGTKILLSVFRSWSYACDHQRLYNMLEHQEKLVQNWQRSFRIAKQSTRTAVEMFVANSIEKFCGKTTLLLIFQSWSNACNIMHLETTVEDMETRVQNWQRSYSISRQATRTAVELFMETTIDKARTRWMVVSFFKSWSHLRMVKNEVAVGEMLWTARRYAEHLWTTNVPPSIVMMLLLRWAYTLKIARLENGHADSLVKLRTSSATIDYLKAELAGVKATSPVMDLKINGKSKDELSSAKAAELNARRVGETLWKANGPPSIVMMLFLRWSYILKITCLEARLRTSATTIANLRAEEAMLLNSAATITNLRAELSGVKAASSVRSSNSPKPVATNAKHVDSRRARASSPFPYSPSSSPTRDRSRGRSRDRSPLISPGSRR